MDNTHTLCVYLVLDKDVLFRSMGKEWNIEK